MAVPSVSRLLMALTSEIPEDLVSSLAKREVLPFVGAGVSMAVRGQDGTRLMPSWAELLGHAAQRLEREQRKQHLLVRAHLEQDQPNYLQAAKYALEGLGGLWPSFLSEQLDIPRERARDDSLDLARKVWTLGSSIVVTTNYDRILQWACPAPADLRQWRISAPGAQASALRHGSERPILWKLHGCVDEPRNVILAPHSYDRLYASSELERDYEAALTTLRTSLLTRTLLFVGFSLDDEHVVAQFEWLRRTFDGSGGPHYAFVHQREAERVRQRVSAVDIQVLSFTDFGDEMLGALDQLAACVGSDSTPPRYLIGGPPVSSSTAGVEHPLAGELDEARRRRDRLRVSGEDYSQAQAHVLAIQRRMREGGVLHAGDVLGERYLLTDSIGEGGFARVWEAIDQRTGARVAVKVLHGQFAYDRSRRERFFRGARVMARLEHTNIVRVIEPEAQDNGFYYFVMERIGGTSLNRAVLDRRVSADRVIPLILDVASALDYAHQHGVVHRDVKPGNVILTGEGIPYLCDFDLVLDCDDTGGTRTGALGTFSYAAPEALQDARSATPASDVYSLAVTLFFMLSGEELPANFLRLGLEQLVEGVRCSPRVRELLLRSLDWEPSTRPRDAGAFRRALLDAVRDDAKFVHSGADDTDVLYWQALGREEFSSLVFRPALVEQVPWFRFPRLTLVSKSSLWFSAQSTRHFRVFPMEMHHNSEDEVETEAMSVDDDLLVDFDGHRCLILGGGDPRPESINEMSQLSRSVHYLGSAGRWLFVRIEDYVYAGGAHGHVGCSFSIYDLERGEELRLGDFLSASELETISTSGRPRAIEAFLQQPPDSRPWLDSSEDGPELVTIVPTYSFPSGKLVLRCQFAADIYYAASDNNWHSYTTSTFIDLDYIPTRLEAYAQLPSTILQYWSEHGVPTGAYGWGLLTDSRHHRSWLDSLTRRGEQVPQIPAQADPVEPPSATITGASKCVKCGGGLAEVGFEGSDGDEASWLECTKCGYIAVD